MKIVKHAAAGLALLSGTMLLLPSTSSAAPTETSTAAGQFLAQVAPANTALATWAHQLPRLGSHPATSRVEAVNEPLSQAMSTLCNQLRNLPAAGKLEADLQLMAAAALRLQNDLEITWSSNHFTTRNWEALTAKDAHAFWEADNVVRQVLALPKVRAATY